MSPLEMEGPYQLTSEMIDRNVTKKSAGNYALGRVKESGRFTVQYIGRSDLHVGSRLHSWVGSKYTHFKFSYAPGAKAAFDKECANFHEFGGSEKLHNKVHPVRPEDSDDTCPVCGAN